MAERDGTPVFQFQPETPGGGSVGATGAAPRLGVSGGQNKADKARVFADTTNIGAGSPLPAFLEEAFSGKIQAIKQQKMWQGFAAAREGMTQEEIHSEQPWYSKIFGPTSYELGAETYGVQKASADMQTQFMDRMGELQQLPTDEVAKELNNMATSMETGNLFTDALIQKSMMERSGPMLEAHGKARYAWEQANITMAQNESWLSNSAAYQSAQSAAGELGTNYPGEEVSAEQSQERKRILLQGLQKPDDQNMESYTKNLRSTGMQLAARGDWHTLAAYEEAGVFDVMPPDMREKFDNQLETANGRYKQRMAARPEFYVPISQIGAELKAGVISAAEGVRRYSEIDQQYSAITGDQRGFFGLKHYIKAGETGAGATLRMHMRMEDKNDRRVEAAQNDEAKAAAVAQGDAQRAMAISTGAIGALKAPYADKDEAFMEFAKADPASIPRIAVENLAVNVDQQEPFVSERLITSLSAQVQKSAGREYTPGFERVYQTWRGMAEHVVEVPDGPDDHVAGPAAAIRYFGEYADQMQVYHDQREAGTPREFAYNIAFGEEAQLTGGQARFKESEKDTEKELRRLIKDKTPKWYSLGSTMIGASANNYVLETLATETDHIRRNAKGAISVEDAAAAAMHNIVSRGLEISGLFAWGNMQGQKQMHQEAGMQKEVFDAHFETLATKRFKASGIDLDKNTSIRTFRIGNDAKGPRLMMFAITSEGQTRSINITGEDIDAIRDKQVHMDQNPEMYWETGIDNDPRSAFMRQQTAEREGRGKEKEEPYKKSEDFFGLGG